MKRIFTLVLASFLYLVSKPAFAQISEGGTPLSFSLNIDMRRGGTPLLEMPVVSNQALLMEDEIARIENEPSPLFRFGYAIDVDINLKTEGIKKELPCGGNLWLLRIHSPDAYSINLIFDYFHLAIGSRFFIYNEDRTMILGAFTPEVSNNQYNVFATELVQGNTIILEYYEPSGSSGGIINISQVIHAYINTFSPGFGTSASCNIDVMCALGNSWRNEQRSVCLIIMGGGMASGALVNNTRQDLTPYILTARHNFFNDNNHGSVPNRNPATAVFRFLYWRPSCGSGNPSNYRSITGATLRATYRSTDVALLELSTIPPFSWNLYYAGWDRTAIPAQNATAIHHPRGDAMKIAHNRNSVVAITWPGNSQPIGALTHWRATFNDGIVQHGSSGSPLFNQNHRIVGQLHGNTNNQCQPWDNDCFCNQTPVGEYGRFDLSWTGGGAPNTRLRDWLDPLGIGTTALSGTRAPFIIGLPIFAQHSCQTTYTLSNIPFHATSAVWSSCANLSLTQDNGLQGATFERTANVTATVAPRFATIYCTLFLGEIYHVISQQVQIRPNVSSTGAVFEKTCQCMVYYLETGQCYYLQAIPPVGNFPSIYAWTVTRIPQTISPMSFNGWNTQSTPFSFPQTGLYRIDLRIMDACGQSLIDQFSVQVVQGTSLWPANCGNGGVLCPFCLRVNCIGCLVPICQVCLGSGCPWCIMAFYYPNPVDDVLTINLAQQKAEALGIHATSEIIFDIRLLDRMGTVVRQQRTQANTIQFDVSNLPEGMYYLHIELNGKIQKHQITIKRN